MLHELVLVVHVRGGGLGGEGALLEILHEVGRVGVEGGLGNILGVNIGVEVGLGGHEAEVTDGAVGGGHGAAAHGGGGGGGGGGNGGDATEHG